MAQKIPEGYVLKDDGCICPPSDDQDQESDQGRRKMVTCPYDPRFPNQNQTKHCYISFIDFQRCTRLLGHYSGCYIFYKCYQALCPQEWTERWFQQMENGTFPTKIYPPRPVIRPSIEKAKGFALEEEEEEGPIC